MKGKIAITTTTFAEYDSTLLSLLKEKGFEVIMNSLGRKMNKEDVLTLCSGCIGIIAGTEEYSKDILKKLKNLRIISRCGVGVDNIDLDAAKELGIKILNTPFGPTLAVAELTIGLMFSVLRNISLMDRELRKGIWKKHMGNLLKGKKVGIIGFGRIGQKVAELLIPFGVEIAYYDVVKNISSCNAIFMEKDDIFRWADLITLHCSASSNNQYIFGKVEFEKMKKGAWFINTSRGEFVDEEALYVALKSGKLAGAGIDAFQKEPYSGNLKELDNVVLTSHIGSYAKESRIEMEIQSVKNLLKKLEG